MNPTKNNTEWTPPKILVQPIATQHLQQAADVVEFLQQHSDTHDAVLAPDIGSSEAKGENAWRLCIGDELPSLHRPDGVSWCIDFRSAKTRRRAAEQDRSQQPLARALGITKLPAEERKTWHVVDGTAGAGADGWQLAAAGASVSWVEQNPVLFTLLNAALQAALEDDNTQAIANHIQVINANVENVLFDPITPLKKPANAVYLDPMYPTRRSKAAVKKPMQFIQALVGRGPAPEEMLMNCLNALNQPELNRVVVKRPAEAPALVSAKDAGVQRVTVNAGAARFDVYLKP